MTNSFEKIISLIKKTGDNFVVLDSKGNPEYVIMGFKSYDRLVGEMTDIASLTEEEFLERINHDIALWKSGSKDQAIDTISAIEEAMKEAKKPSEDPFIDKNLLNKAKKDKDSTDSSGKYYFEPVD